MHTSPVVAVCFSRKEDQLTVKIPACSATRQVSRRLFDDIINRNDGFLTSTPKTHKKVISSLIFIALLVNLSANGMPLLNCPYY